MLQVTSKGTVNVFLNFTSTTPVTGLSSTLNWALPRPGEPFYMAWLATRAN